MRPVIRYTFTPTRRGHGHRARAAASVVWRRPMGWRRPTGWASHTPGANTGQPRSSRVRGRAQDGSQGRSPAGVRGVPGILFPFTGWGGDRRTNALVWASPASEQVRACAHHRAAIPGRRQVYSSSVYGRAQDGLQGRSPAGVRGVPGILFPFTGWGGDRRTNAPG